MNGQTFDILISDELLAPILSEIDQLEAKGCFKEANQYLRTLMAELGLLREARLGVFCLIEGQGDAWARFEQLQSLMMAELQPLRESSRLMYLESLRLIMQALQRALLGHVSADELRSLISELCQTRTLQILHGSESADALWEATLKRFGGASPLH